MILVVDDDPVFLDEARATLDHDRRVFLASRAADALRLSENLGFSVALVDLALDGENGFDLIYRMHRQNPALAIVAISGVVPRHVLESAKEFGAVEVLPKPITPEWKSVVERLRAHRRS